MKSYINKFIASSLVMAAAGTFTACVGDLDQEPKDPSVVTSGQFVDNPQEYIAGLMANCYAGMTVSGQGGAGSSDITSPDAGMSCYSRAIFMLNEFPTDETAWIYFSDAGVEELVKATWGSDNPVLNLAYSRFYTHIAVCNDFLRNMKNLGDWGIDPSQLTSPDGKPMTEEIAQFCLEARVLRAYSYFQVIDFFGRAAVAWDVDDAGNTIPYGTIPPQAESRQALYNKVVADLEDVLANWPAGHTPRYGRIGKDAVRGLLARFYLNEKVFTDGASDAGWKKCWDMCQQIITDHDINANHGLASDYLALFGATNDIFMPGKASAGNNEILMGLPYDNMDTQSYGGTDFLIMGVIGDFGDKELTKGFCNKTWYGFQSAWACMHAREQFSQLFDLTTDGRAYLWLTEDAGYTITNQTISKFTDGYLPIKFTNVKATNGTYYRFKDPQTRLNRISPDASMTVEANYNFCDTDLPLIRLADVYLMAAEASLHGVGSTTTGQQYLNWVRQRAGLAPIQNMTADNVLDERARELYWENLRRTDLIRFGKFTGNAYNWNWKNGTSVGTAIADYMSVYPIPSAIVASYAAGTYQQNPGYVK
ncbi:MAG: RagB/SusD family nutrient uptake outer membrane protein [Muribaculaceae bacterium]|nr:RagB/SusD family nutrient uptake outer membrane protein [Muribaculaceae bacterium]